MASIRLASLRACIGRASRRCLGIAIAAVTVFGSAAAHADFAACTLTNQPLSAGLDPINYVRLALRSDRRPLLAYSTDVHNAASLYLYVCENVACSAGHVRYLDTSSNYFGEPSVLVRSDGRPLIVGSFMGGIRLYDCVDSDCNDYGTHTIRGNGSGIFSDLPMRLQGNGNPALLYVDWVIGPRSGQLIAHFCDDALCDNPGTEQVLAIPPLNSMFASLDLALDSGGKLAASYLTSEGTSNLYKYDIARCADVGCTNVGNTELSAPVSDSTPTRTVLAMRSSDRPLALDSQANNRALLDCTSNGCTAADNRLLPANMPGQPFGLTLLSGNLPAFAWSSAGKIGAYACADATCSSGHVLQADSATQDILDGDFAISVDARPVVAYIDFDTRTLAVAACDGDVVFKNGFD